MDTKSKTMPEILADYIRKHYSLPINGSGGIGVSSVADSYVMIGMPSQYMEYEKFVADLWRKFNCRFDIVGDRVRLTPACLTDLESDDEEDYDDDVFVPRKQDYGFSMASAFIMLLLAIAVTLSTRVSLVDYIQLAQQFLGNVTKHL